MHKTRFLLGALLCLPFVAHAASFASIESARCTGTLSSSLAAEASYLCTGDLYLIGGRISSDAAVVLHADGALFLDNLSITAPTIDLWSFGRTVTVGSGASLRGGRPAGAITDPGAGGGTLQISPGGNVSLVGGGGRASGSITGPTPGGGTVRISAGGDILLSGGGDIVRLASPVPEPSAALMMCVGLLALLGVGAGRKRRG